MTSAVYQFGAFVLDPAKRELWRGEEPVVLPPRAFECLLLLVEQRDRAVARAELTGRLWHHGQASDVQLGQLILQCRRAVDDDGQAQQAIRTIAGFGYRWVAPTQVRPAAPATTSVPASSLDRPASANAAGTPVAAAPARPRRQSGPIIALVLFAMVAVAGATYRMLTGTGATPTGQATALLVLPLDAPADQRWIRLGGMDLVVERLRRAGFHVLPSETTLALVGQHPDGDDRVQRIAHQAGVGHVVAGTAGPDDGQWQVRLSAHAHDGADLPRHGQARADDAVQAIRAAADHLATVLGRPPPSEPVPSTPLAETLSRARAALLAGEPESARAALLDDPALAADQPLLRLQLAEIDLRTGRFDDAEQAALALLDEAAAEAGDWRGQVLNVLATARIRRGDYARAGEDFTAAIAALGDHADPLWIGRAYLGRGVSRTAMQNASGAMADYGQASDAFGRAGDSASLARIDNNIGALELLRGHPARAMPYLERGLAQAQALGLVHEHVSGLRLLATARHEMLDHTAAFTTIEAAWALRDRFPNPNTTLSVTLFRVRALIALGRLSEAGAVLAQLPDGEPADPADALLRQWLTATRLAWLGRPGDALDLLRPVPEAIDPVAELDSLVAQIALLRSRLERQLGVVRPDDPAEPAFPDDPRLPLRRLAQANRAWTGGDDAGADAAFRDALAAAERLDVRATTATVIADYVPYLLQRDRLADAIAAGHRVAIWADHDFDCAVVGLRLAHARDDEHAWRQALARARQLAGERPIEPALTRWR